MVMYTDNYYFYYSVAFEFFLIVVIDGGFKIMILLVKGEDNIT